MWLNRRFHQPPPGQLGGPGLGPLGLPDQPSPDLPSTPAPAAATPEAPGKQSPVWVRVLESFTWLGYTGMVIWPPPYYHSEHE